MSIHAWETVNTWDARTWTKTAFTVAYADLDADSPFYGDTDYSAIVIGDECWYDPTTLPDVAVPSMSGDGVFTLSDSWDEDQTFDFAIYDTSDGTLGTIGTITAEFFLHELTADNIESASELTSPAISIIHNLLTDNVESASELTSPTLAVLEADALLADNIESASELSSPVVGQAHSLLSADIESASELSQPVLTQIHNLTVVSVASSSELTSPSVADIPAGTKTLLAENIESTSEITTPTLRLLSNDTTGGWDYPKRPDPEKERVKLGIIKKPAVKRKLKSIKQIPSSFNEIKSLQDIEEQRQKLEGYLAYQEEVKRRGINKKLREEADKEALIKIYMSINALEERQAQIEEQDIVFIISMLAA